MKLRSKQLVAGRQSLYLDIYRDGRRQYEFLHLYLLPPSSAEARRLNRETLAEAELIRARRELAEIRGGGRSERRVSSDEGGGRGKERRKDAPHSSGAELSWPPANEPVARMVRLFDPPVRPEMVDTEWVRRFIVWLREDYRKSDGGRLAESTCVYYASRLSSAISMAVREGRMSEHPFRMLPKEERPRMPECRREFLTPEELLLLAATPCRHEMVKRAYLFSCHSSLRISDVRTLRWCDLSRSCGRMLLSFVMKKTGKAQCIPLPRVAAEWLPERRAAPADSLIFEGLPSLPTVEKTLREWAARAGVEKYLSYHTSRHTFGTMMMTAGADLYTTSRLMGHADPATTRIYARILDKRKIEAIEMLDRLYEGMCDYPAYR